MRHHVGVMQATDMRSLSREARHERRVQVVRLRKAGRTYDEILQHYYSGIELGTVPAKEVRVLLAEGRRAVTIASTVHTTTARMTIYDV